MNNLDINEKQPRAEELIAGIYQQILEMKGSGKSPARVIISRLFWNIIDDYRQGLGTLDGPLPDYLSEDSLFGLEIWYGDDPNVRVE